ncbi:hypothetical protein SAY87_007664 [Trapa incisa]|uniref:Uncharacterized protein n=1 Tax=Trapa incisa TaxID=236973 RepID=A0AAN7QF81_9MYRT|nr:hypothetical protein SAY87_007664 [Trapa incisa]
MGHLLMAPFWSLLGMFMLLSASSFASHQLLHHISTISAAPASLPPAPLLSPVTIPAAPATLPGAPESQTPSPALSPDIFPVLPSPKGGAATPTESSIPIIPSSPSPPNPDGEPAGGTMTAPLVPSGVEPVVSGVQAKTLAVPILILSSLAVYLMQIIGV